MWEDRERLRGGRNIAGAVRTGHWQKAAGAARIVYHERRNLHDMAG